MDSNNAKPWASLNWPNRISIMRLLLVGPFAVMLLQQRHWPQARYFALAILLVMAVSDFLDGMLARRLNARTRLGAILDPLADKVLIICAAIMLALDSSSVEGAQLPSWVVVAIVGKDLWVIMGFVVVYLVTDRFRICPGLAGKVSTACQLGMVVLFLIAPDLNRFGGHLGTKVAMVSAWIVAGMCILSVLNYTKMGLGFVAGQDKPLDSNGKE